MQPTPTPGPTPTPTPTPTTSATATATTAAPTATSAKYSYFCTPPTTTDAAAAAATYALLLLFRFAGSPRLRCGLPGSVVSGLARPTSRPCDRVQAKPECVFGKLALESLEFVYSVRLVTNCSGSLFILFCKHRQTPGAILMQRRRGTASFQEL